MPSSLVPVARRPAGRHLGTGARQPGRGEERRRQPGKAASDKAAPAVWARMARTYARRKELFTNASHGAPCITILPVRKLWGTPGHRHFESSQTHTHMKASTLNRIRDGELLRPSEVGRLTEAEARFAKDFSMRTPKFGEVRFQYYVSETGDGWWDASTEYKGKTEIIANIPKGRLWEVLDFCFPSRLPFVESLHLPANDKEEAQLCEALRTTLDLRNRGRKARIVPSLQEGIDGKYTVEIHGAEWSTDSEIWLDMVSDGLESVAREREQSRQLEDELEREPKGWELTRDYRSRLIAAAPEMKVLLERLRGFALHYASESALNAGGDFLIEEANDLLRWIGEPES